MWIYLVTCLPIFLSDEASKVRDAIAPGGGNLAETLSPLRRFNPRALVRRTVICHVQLRNAYQGAASVRRKLLWTASELLFPCDTAPYFLGVLWAFTLAALAFSLQQSRKDTT